jgi:hypothetical protein
VSADFGRLRPSATGTPAAARFGKKRQRDKIDLPPIHHTGRIRTGTPYEQLWFSDHAMFAGSLLSSAEFPAAVAFLTGFCRSEYTAARDSRSPAARSRR